MFTHRILRKIAGNFHYCKHIRKYGNRNLLSLVDRDFIHDVFPSENKLPMEKALIGSSQTIYAGFDPTAESLHVGNLLVLIGLLHAQRGGHQPIALLGGATGLIGDPSGRNTERVLMKNSTIERNISSIKKQIEGIFENHEKLLSKIENKRSRQLLPIKIVNNAEWYGELNVIEFIGNIGRNFRMGCMLSRHSVQTRLKSEEGMSFTEFTYQIFQAYDWWHLFKTHNCRFQIGGSDQMGNMMSGQELISRTENKRVFGMTLPIVTNEEGDKFGKSAGNAVWLDRERTSPFSFYQFFLRVPDSEVEKLLKLFTFIPVKEIANIMEEHKRVPELRDAQKHLAREITLLVHGEEGLKRAEFTTEALYKGNIQALGELSYNELKQTVEGASYCEILPDAEMNMLQLAMKVKCFPTEKDAIRIITAGGFYVNQSRVQNIAEVLCPSIHILKNGLSLIRVGKKNYYIVRWLT